MGSVHERLLDLLSGIWLHLGFRLSVGLDAVSLRTVDFCERLRLDVAARELAGMAENSRAGEPASGIPSAGATGQHVHSQRADACQHAAGASCATQSSSAWRDHQ